MSYYNTNSETGEVLTASVKQTEKQEQIVISFFENNPEIQLTALELADKLNILFTSVRRAVTDLEKEGKLQYCGMKMERFGKMNRLIKLT